MNNSKLFVLEIYDVTKTPHRIKIKGVFPSFGNMEVLFLIVEGTIW